jgi:DNA-binding PadR family transcriptional regulator
MSTSSSPDPLSDFRSLIDRVQETFASRAAEDEDGGDVRGAILVELVAEPMHGYQLIKAIEARSGGRWSPRPGTVYPTLQLLADEGLVSATSDGERRVYALTEAGRAAAAKAGPGDGDGSRPGGAYREALALPAAGARLAQAMAQFGRSTTPDQQQRAVAIVDEARRRLYAILAED